MKVFIHVILTLVILHFLLNSSRASRITYITTDGRVCKDECTKRGYSYYWCNTRDNDWQKCSAENSDIEGNTCHSKCGQDDDTVWTTCRTDDSDDAYCGTMDVSTCDVRESVVSSTKTLSASGEFKDGHWGPSEYCPEDQFVVGVSLLVQPNIGGGADDRGLEGIKLYCAKTWKNMSSDNECSITSEFHVARRASWTDKQFCSGGFANGFELKTWESQGANDDFGATNFNLHCADDTILRYSFDYEPGAWPNSPSICTEKTAICGIRTKVESNDHHNDNTGLNAVDIYCCKRKLKTPEDVANVCEPNFHWERIAYSDNRLGLTATKYKYTEKTGFSKTESTRNLERLSKTSGTENTWGIENELELGSEIFTPGVQNTLTLKFEQKFSSSSTTDEEKEKGLSNAFENEKEHSVEIDILPGVEFSLYQYVGSCGPFVVYPYIFNRTDLKNLQRQPQHEHLSANTTTSSGYQTRFPCIVYIFLISYYMLQQKAYPEHIAGSKKVSGGAFCK